MTVTAVPGLKQAEQDHAAAAAAVETAEAQIAAGGRGISFEKLHNLRDRARHATLTAQGARERTERDRVAARLAALEALGEQADSLAASDGGGIPEALQEVADAVARVRALAGEWDANVGALTTAARELGAEAAAPAGPRKTSAFVAVTGDGLTYKRTQLRPIAGKIEQILAHAVAGDVISAVAAARMVTEQPAPHRAEHYFGGSNGLIVVQDGVLNPGMEAQLRAGNLTPLTESEIQKYLAGELA
jgi:hypothetical protein